MNYLKHYIKLIRKAQLRKLKGYKEKHHVFPKSIYGDNNYIVNLTAREHFLAHIFLYKRFNKIYGSEHFKTQKMLYTCNMMGTHKNKKNKINSRIYENLKKIWSKQHSKKMSECQYGKNNTRYGAALTEKHKQALKNANTGKKYIKKDGIVKKVPKEEVEKYLSDGWSLGTHKFSKEHRKNLSKSNKGKKHSNETKKKLSEITKKQMTPEARKYLSDINKGKNNPNYGMIWITDGTVNKKIKPKDLKDYPSFKKGRTNSGSFGKKWVNKNGQRKYIEKSQLQDYLSQGWDLGMK